MAVVLGKDVSGELLLINNLETVSVRHPLNRTGVMFVLGKGESTLRMLTSFLTKLGMSSEVREF